MTNTMQMQVLDFHDSFGHPIGNIGPQLISKERSKLRHKLIKEELKEYKTAMQNRDIVEVADALGDLLYVVYGAAVEHGLDMEGIFDEIHNSNMSKLDTDGRAILREDGKILKGPNYRAPELFPVLLNQRDLH